MSVLSLLENILSNTSLVLWVVDANGTFLLSRGAGLQDIGLADDEVVGQCLFDMYANYPDVCDQMRRALRGETSHEFTDVEGACFENWFCPLVNDDGETLGMVGISNSITELSQTRERLKENRFRFEAMFNQGPAMMALVANESGKIIEVNDAFTRVTGISQSDAAGRQFQELDLFSSTGIETLANPTIENEPFELTTRSGERRLFRLSTRTFRYQGVLSCLVIGQDVTKEELARAALMESEFRFESLAMQAPVGIFQCDRDGRIFFANPHFWSCFDIEALREQYPTLETGSINPELDVCWYQLFQDEYQTLQTVWQRRITQKTPFRMRLSPLVPARDVETVSLHLQESESGRFLGTLIDMTGVARAESVSALRQRELEKAVRSRTAELDHLNRKLTTEAESRKQAAEELQLSQGHLQAVLENAVDLICHVDKEGRIKYVNRVVTPGVRREDVIDSKVFSWMKPEYLEPSREALRAVIEQEKQIELEMQIDIGEEDRCINSRWGPVYSGGEVVGATIVGTDVTEIRRLEAVAKQRQAELAHLSRLSLMGEMSARLSHELKQPLMSIGGFARGCLYRVRSGEMQQAELETMLEQIADLSLQARKIVQQTRDFVANRPFLKQRSDLHEIVNRSLELVRAELSNVPVAAQLSIPEDIPKVNVDPTQIQQVFVNLLLNAIDAIRTSRKAVSHAISVSASLKRDGYVTVRIEDTGDGIQGIENDRLFAAFQSTKENGLGMGLAICRGILENHLGELRLVSTSAEGTIFEADLPL
ncbi:PAS domain S-box protein [Rubinisphaera margarita]|uniref:PAS domain S-box protein n=1 Tax=Rubinisphaera margarita TaxID=2909586 RepID=UPI001EE78DBC|nr:PAS domain S-box protein [Rubinisphaera margarita]MCG6157858.1 PAS domain S-box protein [Rubinisphaera margarita]